MSSFGGMYLALPYMLDFFQVPADLFQLFVVGTVATSQLWSALAAMNGVVICVLGACAVLGHLSWLRLTIAAAVCLVVSIVFFWLLSFAFKGVLPDPNIGEQRLLSLQLIETPVAVRTVDDPQPLGQNDLARDRLAIIRERGRLRAGFHGLDPPFNFSNANGDMVGLDMELMHALAADLEVSLELVPVETEVMDDHLSSGRIDILIGGISITPERALHLSFTRPYIYETPSFLVLDHKRSDFLDLQAVKSMPGLRLGIPPLYFRREVEKAMPQAKIVEVDSPQPFLRGETDLDALLISAQMGSAWTLIFPEYTVVIPRGLDINVPKGFALPVGSARFRDFIDTWLEVMIKTGAVEEYNRHWVMGQDARGKAPRWSVIRDLLGWVE